MPGLRLFAAALAAAAVTLLAAPAAHADSGRFAGLDLAPTKEGPPTQQADITALCGKKPIRVALSDGFGSNSWRRIVRREFEDEAAKCKTIVETRYTDGQGSTQKQISDIGGLVAQHFDVILVYPDGGEAILKAMRDATKAGVAVVPYDVGVAFPGKRGRDYLLVTTESLEAKAATEAEWIARNLNGQGNVIVLGGTPGNPTSIGEEVGWKKVYARFPGIKVLEGPVDTNWDPAEAQRVMSSLLAKYPKIDAVYSDYGLGAMGALRAYVAAGRQIPLWASEDANELGCFWEDHKAANPGFKLATVSGRTWLVRLALRKAVAAVEGLNDPEPSIIDLPLFEDSTSSDPKLAPHCDRHLPPDAILSTELTRQQLGALFK